MIRFLCYALFVTSWCQSLVWAGEAVPGRSSGLTGDESVHWGILENGVRYAIKTNNQPQDKSSVRLLITAGSLFEDDVQLGLAHYLEHLAFNGTTHYPPGTLITQLQALGLSFGADTNAHTSFDETVYKLDLPDAKPATVAIGMRVLSDYAGGMLLVPSEIDRERGIIMSEMRDRNTPSLREVQVLYKAMYPGKRIAQRFPIGVPETVNAADRAQLMKFYNDWYRPERFVVVAVGAFEPAAVAIQIRDAFSMLAAAVPARAEPDLGQLTPSDLIICAHREPEAEGTTVSFMHLRQQQRPADSAKTRIQMLTNKIGDSILSTRLMKWTAAHAEGALLKASAYSTQRLDIYHAGIDAKVRPTMALAAIPIIEQEMRRFYEHGPTAMELATAVAQIKSQLESAVAKQDGRTNSQLANAIYQASKFDEAFLSPAQELTLLMPALTTMTPKEVMDAFRAAWSGGNPFISVSGADDLGADSEMAIRSALRGSQAIAVTAPPEAKVETWGYGQKPADPVTNASEENERKRKTELFAKRGIKMDSVGPIDVVVKRTEYKQNEILIQIRLQTTPEPRPAGWNELVERAFLAGGLGLHSAESLGDVLAGTSTRLLAPVFSDDGVTFLATCLPKDLEVCFQRLVAQMSDPGWRSEAEIRSKAEWLDELTAAETNLDAQVSFRFQALSVHDAPHRRAATREEAQAATFAQVRPWFEKLLATSPMQVSIVGDIDEAGTLSLARLYFSTMAKNRKPMDVHLGPAKEFILPSTQPIPTGVHRFAVQGTVRRSLMRIAWPTTDFYDVEKTRRLGVLAQVISERMRIRIREELGDAYSPFAHRFASEAYAGYGYVIAQVGVAPEKAEEARSAILEIAKDLATNGVTDELLNSVITPVIKNLASQRQQNQYWLRAVIDRCIQQPFRLEWAATMETDYAAMTAADLSKLAKQYLDNEKALQVIAVCEGK
jgi:zinc protease